MWFAGKDVSECPEIKLSVFSSCEHLEALQKITRNKAPSVMAQKRPGDSGMICFATKVQHHVKAYERKKGIPGCASKSSLLFNLTCVRTHYGNE